MAASRPHYRSDIKTGSGMVLGKTAQQLDMLTKQAYLLFGLLSSIDGRTIMLLDTPPENSPGLDGGADDRFGE
jgi:hypothetical protein